MNQSVSNRFAGVTSIEEALIVVRSEPTIIASFPDTLLTDDILYEALSRDESVYDLIDPIFFSEELINRLVLNDIRALNLVPPHKLSRAHLLAVVEQDGMNICSINPKRLDTEVCITAINSAAEAHDFVPQELQSPEYINQLIKSRPDFVDRIDVEQRNPEIIGSLLDSHPNLIRYLAMPDRTAQRCKQVLALDPTTAQYFPEKIYDSAEFLALMSSMDFFAKPTSVHSATLVRKSLANMLFENNVDIYKHLPDSVKTEAMAVKAVIADPENAFVTPSSLKRNDVVWGACITHHEHIFDRIPEYEQGDQVRIFVARKKALRASKSIGEELT